MRPLVMILCAALLASAHSPPALAGQALKRAKKARPAAAQPAQAPQTPAFNPGELAAPYSALNRGSSGQAAVDSRQGRERTDLADRYQSNATSWKVDLTPRPKDSEDDSALRFHLGRETALDPVTREPLTPRADPLGAKKSLEELDLKGAADKLGGKAEVQVDVLKF